MASRSFSSKEPDRDQAESQRLSRAKRLITEPGEVGKEDATEIFNRAKLVAAERSSSLIGVSIRNDEQSPDRFSMKLGNGSGIEGCRMPMNRKVFDAINAEFGDMKGWVRLRRELRRVVDITFEHKPFDFVLDIGGHKVKQEVECAVLQVEHMKYDSKMSTLEATAVLNILKHQIQSRTHLVEDQNEGKQEEPEAVRIRLDYKDNGVEQQIGILRKN